MRYWKHGLIKFEVVPTEDHDGGKVVAVTVLKSPGIAMSGSLLTVDAIAPLHRVAGNDDFRIP